MLGGASARRPPMPRVLVLIVDCDADRRLEGLLGRLPRELLESDSCHLLVVGDDEARGAADGPDWLRERGFADGTVLHAPIELGPGGRRKLGYRYALDSGFDLVVQLPGDDSYGPELLPAILESLEGTGAGLVLGTRTGGAGNGGTGHRLLTGLQDLLTGRSLSDYGSGCRGLSRDLLRSVPFEIATNDGHFDTELLLQALTVGARVEEIDVSAHVDAEAAAGTGRSAAAELASTIVYRMHHLGMLCSLKHRDLGTPRYRSKSSVPYSSHARALGLVARESPATLLDLGCGPGHVAKRCEELGVRVTGIDREPPLPDSMSEFHLADLEHPPLPVDALAYDMVLLLDVIEHLANPEELLLAVRNSSRQPAAEAGTRLILTTPNVAFAAVRLNLLVGRFNYAERGILDITHKRLFTRRSLLATLEDCGYRVDRLEGIGVPFGAVFRGRWARPAGALSDLLARLWPGLFAFQFLAVCRPLPGVRQLLDASRRPPSPAQSR